MANYTFIFQAQAGGGVAFFCRKGKEAATSPAANVPVKLTEGDTVGFLLLPVAGSAESMDRIELAFTPSGGGTRKDEILMPFFIAPPPAPAPAPVPTNVFTWKTGDADAVLVQTRSNWTFVGTLFGSDQSVFKLTDPEMQVGDGGG
jgi:hypothetical protein